MEGLNLKQLATAVRSIAEEKNLPEDTVLDIVQQAIAAAWKHDHDEFRNADVRAILNQQNGTA